MAYFFGHPVYKKLKIIACLEMHNYRESWEIKWKTEKDTHLNTAVQP